MTQGTRARGLPLGRRPRLTARLRAGVHAVGPKVDVAREDDVVLVRVCVCGRGGRGFARTSLAEPRIRRAAGVPACGRTAVGIGEELIAGQSVLEVGHRVMNAVHAARWVSCRLGGSAGVSVGRAEPGHGTVALLASLSAEQAVCRGAKWRNCANTCAMLLSGRPAPPPHRHRNPGTEQRPTHGQHEEAEVEKLREHLAPWPQVNAQPQGVPATTQAQLSKDSETRG